MHLLSREPNEDKNNFYPIVALLVENSIVIGRDITDRIEKLFDDGCFGYSASDLLDVLDYRGEIENEALDELRSFFAEQKNLLVLQKLLIQIS